MEAKAQARYVRVTPMKARRVVDTIRGKGASEALTQLEFAPQAAAKTVSKVIGSAIANARFKADERSEERRVGKECRRRGTREQSKKIKGTRTRARLPESSSGQ